MSFATCSQCQITLLLHKRLSFRRRNIPVLRNSLTRCNARHLRNVGVRQHLSS